MVKATVLRPLALTRQGDLDLGTIVLNPGTWSGATVSVSAAGIRICSANVTCGGAVSAARYNLTGTNKLAVAVSAPAVVMTNSTNAAQTLTLTLLAPATITIPNAGSAGLNFAVGGMVSLSSSTPPGLYTGTLEVTVDYQ